ncbi:MAG: hypothetical protein HY973_01665, partial [Candidatus Kerfeldbacteria bacterium]|nr:hypothetical protein [Candidatus Kerfeldbacteria bacterium]
MEKKCILADGRIVIRGPWINRSGYYLVSTHKFRIGIYAISQEMLQHNEKYGDNLDILEVGVPVGFCGNITLPKIQILNQELWTRDLLTEVIRVLRQSNEYSQRVTEYVAGKLSRMFEKEKELILKDNNRLVGDLDSSLGWGKGSSPGHEDLQIWGNIKNPQTGNTEKTNLLTINDLYILIWPGSTKTPTYVKNKEIWCKKLEFLVINYLNLLV